MIEGKAMPELETIAVLDAEVFAKAKGNGVIGGYAAVFNNVDADRDIIMPGAFKKTIRERVAAGKVGLMVRHIASGGDTIETIGLITTAVEDKKGLKIEADLFDGQLAQETRGKIQASPNLFGMSIGYKIVRSEDRLDEGGDVIGKKLLELALYEVTITIIPANDATQGSVYAKSEEAQFEELRERLAALEAKVEARGQTPPATEQSAGGHDYRRQIDRHTRELAVLKSKAQTEG